MGKFSVLTEETGTSYSRRTLLDTAS